MKQNAICAVFFLVCCLLVVLSPSFATTVKRANGDVGYALFKASRTHPVSGAITFYQRDLDLIISGQFNSGFTDHRSFATCRLLILTTPVTDLTPFVVNVHIQNGGTVSFSIVLTDFIIFRGETLQNFKNKKLVVRCGVKTIGKATIKVIP